MNEMELLQRMAQETPLPALAELDAARARLGAAIAADPRRSPRRSRTHPPVSRLGRYGPPRQCGAQPGSCMRGPSAPPQA